MKNNIVKVKSGRQGNLRPGHPWIFKSQLLKPDKPIKGGSLVSVSASNDKLLGWGYYNPNSMIAVRILTFKDEPVDAAFFDRKIKEAVAKRADLLQNTNALRIVFSEADGLPGLIVDLYGDTAVFQMLTLGMEHFKPEIVSAIKVNIGARYIYEKSDGPFRKQESLKVVKSWHGDKGNRYNTIVEGPAKFVVDIYEGHKTGFYLDQRPSRLALQALSKGKRVLDLFSYTGGFAIHAALGGATHVTAVDIKEDWLKLGMRNAELNNVTDKIEFIEADSFEYLKNICASGEKFDIIIVDPPSFLKARHSIAAASKGYKELNHTAMKCLNENGILATFSCSHNMPNEVFSNILRKAASEAGKSLTILKRCHQAQDHPIVRQIPETEYLKGYFFRASSIKET